MIKCFDPNSRNVTDPVVDAKIKSAQAADPSRSLEDILQSLTEEELAAWSGQTVEDHRANKEWRRAKLVELGGDDAVRARAGLPSIEQIVEGERRRDNFMRLDYERVNAEDHARFLKALGHDEGCNGTPCKCGR